MRQHAAVAGSDEARPGGVSIPTPYASPLRRRSGTLNDRRVLMSGVDRETARRQVRERVEEVLSGWRDGVATPKSGG